MSKYCKLSTLIKLVISFLFLTTIIILFNNFYGKNKQNNEVNKNETVEPILKVGTYYLKSDDLELYFEVMPNNIIQFQGEFEQKHNFFSLQFPNYNISTDDERSNSEEIIYNYIKFWNTPYRFVVHTYNYPNEKITYICNDDNNSSHPVPLGSLVYIDEKTLMYCGYYFILNE